MRFYVAFVALLLVSNLAGQKKIDNEQILCEIVNNQSPFYYPALEVRYKAGDTTLTVDDYVHLYYGYAYQDSYKPLDPISAQDKITMLFATNPEPSVGQAEKLVEYATEVMARDPFSPKNINFLTYAYGMLGDTINEKINADRLKKIIAAIQSTGSGTKENEPWGVLSFDHSTDILAVMELQPMKRMVVSRSVEYIPLLEKHGNIKGYYFDFSRVYWNKPESRPEKRSAGLEFNGLKPKSKR